MLNIVSGLLGTPTPVATNSYESIATVTVGSGGASTVTFSSIPSTYKHLQVRYIAKNTAAAGYYVLLQMNSDTGANYSYHTLSGSTGTPVSAGAASQTYIPCPRSTESGVTSVFSAGIVDVLDYASTSKYKTVRAIGGKDTNTANTGYVDFNSGAWMNTAAVNTLTFSFGTGTYAEFSQFALYGIKG